MVRSRVQVVQRTMAPQDEGAQRAGICCSLQERRLLGARWAADPVPKIRRIDIQTCASAGSALQYCDAHAALFRGPQRRHRSRVAHGEPPPLVQATRSTPVGVPLVDNDQENGPYSLLVVDRSSGVLRELFSFRYQRMETERLCLSLRLFQATRLTFSGGEPREGKSKS